MIKIKVKRREQNWLLTSWNLIHHTLGRMKMDRKAPQSIDMLFYEPDFFRNNGYTHVIINFTEKGDEELFKKLTMFILSDIKKDNFIVDPNGMQTELFETTVRSSI